MENGKMPENIKNTFCGCQLQMEVVPSSSKHDGSWSCPKQESRLKW